MSKFTSDSIYYTLSTYVLQFALFFVNIVTKQMLGPEQLGAWAFIQIILTYLSIVDLGVVDAGWKEIAFNYSKKDPSKTQQYLSSMFGYNLVTSLSVSFFLFLYALIFVRESFIFFGIIYLGVSFPFVRINNCFISYYRAVSEFKLLSRFNIIAMLNNSLIGIVLVYFFGLYGMYSATFINIFLLSTLWFTIYKKKNKLVVDFTFKNYIPLLKIGLPLVFGGALFTVFRSLDSLYVKMIFGNEMLGFYSMGFSLAGYIFLIPNSLSVVLFSKFQDIYAKSIEKDNNLDLLEKADQIQKIIGIVILPLLIGAVFFFSDFIITSMAPKFITYIKLIQIIILGIFPLALIHVPNQLLITQNKFKEYILISTGVVFFLVISLFVGSSIFKLDTSSVAIITAISYLFYFISIYIIAFKGNKKLIYNLSSYLFTFFYFVSVSLVINSINITAHFTLFISSALNFVLFMFFLLPIFYYFDYKTGSLSKLAGIIIKKRN